MQGIHDLGGTDGFTLPVRDQGRVPAEEWERQIWSLLFSLSLPGVATGGRAAIEAIPPALYLSMPYYARWLYIQEQALLSSGIVSEDELRNPDGPITIPEIPNFVAPSAEAVLAFLAQDSSAELDEDVPAMFAVGEAVVAKNEYPAGFTRMPGYIKGHRGVIQKDHGVYPFQDFTPAGLERRFQHLYTVRFRGTELWGSRGHPSDNIFVDLWDDHLEPAN